MAFYLHRRNKWYRGLGVLLGASIPLQAFAQSGQLTRIVVRLDEILDRVIPILVALGLLVFLWGLARFIFRAGNEEEQKRGKQVMLWGIIALFVMVSILGIIRFIANALEIETAPITFPAPSPIPSGDPRPSGGSPIPSGDPRSPTGTTLPPPR